MAFTIPYDMRRRTSRGSLSRTKVPYRYRERKGRILSMYLKRYRLSSLYGRLPPIIRSSSIFIFFYSQEDNADVGSRGVMLFFYILTTHSFPPSLYTFMLQDSYSRSYILWIERGENIIFTLYWIQEIERKRNSSFYTKDQTGTTFRFFPQLNFRQ